MTIGKIKQKRLGQEIGPVVLFILASTLLLLAPSVCVGYEPKKVLIFYSDDVNLPANVLLNQQLRSALKGSVPDIQIFHDNLDSFMIRDDQYEVELLALLKRKYREMKFDLIVPFGGPALEFLLKHRDNLVPGAPIVFVLMDKSRIEGMKLGSNITGVWGKLEVRPHSSWRWR